MVEFSKLKESYISAQITFEVSNNQFAMSSTAYENEILKPPQEQNKNLISSHLTLKSTLDLQKSRLLDLEKQLKELVARKSPYLINEIKMPKYGTKDFFDPDHIKMFPVVSGDDDISIKNLFELLSEWGEGIGLSEKGIKHALFSRLRGKRAKAWLTYNKLPLKEAVTNLILLFDKIESKHKHSTDIENFKPEVGEDIQNSVQRLLQYINKYLEYIKDNKERKILRKEYLKSKLSVLLSPRAYREVFRAITLKDQIGEEVSEKELLSLIHTESMFDQRTKEDKSYNINLNNIKLESEEGEEGEEGEEDTFELSAIEHKRPSMGDTFSRQPKIQKHNDRKILVPNRKHDGSKPNPIIIGRNSTPYVTVNNPTMSKYHPRNPSNQSSSPTNSFHQRNSNDRVKEFIHSRNSPLIRDSRGNQQYSNQYRNFDDNRYSKSFENFRTNNRQRWNSYPSNDYKNSYPSNDYITGPRFNNSYRNRNSYKQNNGLRHNLQVRTNPPAIFQQISMDELNSLCVNCPKDLGNHKVSDCPKLEGQVFRRASRINRNS